MLARLISFVTGFLLLAPVPASFAADNVRGPLRALLITGGRGCKVLAIIALDLGDPELIVGVPEALPGFLGWFVFQVAFPRGNCLLTRPVGNRNAESICAAGR